MIGYNPDDQRFPSDSTDAPTVELALPGVSRARRHRWIVSAVLAVVLVASGIGGYLWWYSPVSYTYSGATVVNAGDVLEGAEEKLASLVRTRRGAVNDDTRCYFAVAAPPEGGESAAIDGSVWCGAVYLPDSTDGECWLDLDLKQESAAGDGVRLGVSPAGESARTEQLPEDVALSRPDRHAAVSDDGGMDLPQPPPSEPDLLASLTREQARQRGIDVPAVPEPVVMKGWGFGIELTGHGRVTRFGTGSSTRGPAPGHRLYALAVSGIAGESADARIERAVRKQKSWGSVRKSTSLRVRVAGDKREIADSSALKRGANRVLLVSVPAGAKQADLVLAERGLRQTLSLRTGKPGADNPAVLGRTDVSTDLPPEKGEFTVRARGRGKFVDSTASYELISARLAYYRGYDARNHAPDGTAYLLLWGGMELFDENRSLIPELISLRLPDGSTRRASNHTDRDGHVWIAIEVPADFNRGTLVIGGSLEFDNDISLTAKTEKRVKLSIKD